MELERTAFVVPITKTYLNKGRALIKSLAMYHPKTDVHVLTIDLVGDEFKDLREVIVYHVPELPADTVNNEFKRVRTSRFKYAADLKDSYDTICLLDADMVLIRNIMPLFLMATSGAILVSSNNTLLRYVKKDFDAQKVDAPDDINVVHPSFCTVPLVINPTIHNAFLNAVWDNELGNDLDTPNLLMQAMGLMQFVFYLTSYSVTNIHHSMLKPDTFAREMDGTLYSQMGEPVYMLHGHWDDDVYVKNLLEPMVKNYSDFPRAVKIATDAIQTIKREYDKYKC